MTSPSRDEIPESELDKEKLSQEMRKLNRKHEKLSNDKQRLEETRIDDRQSQSQMQNKILESNGLNRTKFRERFREMDGMVKGT